VYVRMNIIVMLCVIKAYDFILRGNGSVLNLLEINYKFGKIEYIS
jgi:hypothetical protein